ncbi:unnamed protein product [Cylindrotheca closterium]|uniref:Kinesin light chain n=1 Tax=Cylindrotheca closterium TaxID=2856 RepID=A0AAD2CK78_9STRA|nr:unnamed protein product [Cylindrotheca closterium]
MEANELESVEKIKEKGILYFHQGNYQKAREMLEKVLEIQTKELGEDDLSVALTTHHIGNVLMREGKYDEALETLTRALEIRHTKLGASHDDTVKTYELIGSVFMESGDHEKAEKYYRTVVVIKSKFHSLESPALMNLNQNLALSLQRQGKFSEAQKIQKEVLANLLQVYGEDHSDVVLVYIATAGLLYEQNRPKDAHQMLDKSIEVCYRLKGLGDFNTQVLVRALSTKAGMLEVQGDLEGFTGTLNKVLMVQKETLGEMHPSTADAYENLADAYLGQDMLDECINALTKTLEFRRKVLGNGHPRTQELVSVLKPLKRGKIARALNEQGLAMRVQGDMDKAIQLFQEALDIYKETFLHTHPDMMAVYENVSAVKIEQGLLDDGIAASAEALKIRRRTLGDDHTDTKGSMEAHRSLLRRLLESQS